MSRMGQLDFLSHQLSHLATVPQIHLAIATKPPMLIIEIITAHRKRCCLKILHNGSESFALKEIWCSTAKNGPKKNITLYKCD